LSVSFVQVHWAGGIGHAVATTASTASGSGFGRGSVSDGKGLQWKTCGVTYGLHEPATELGRRAREEGKELREMCRDKTCHLGAVEAEAGRLAVRLRDGGPADASWSRYIISLAISCSSFFCSALWRAEISSEQPSNWGSSGMRMTAGACLLYRPDAMAARSKFWGRDDSTRAHDSLQSNLL
jgi:hypothetical protein